MNTVTGDIRVNNTFRIFDNVRKFYMDFHFPSSWPIPNTMPSSLDIVYYPLTVIHISAESYFSHLPTHCLYAYLKVQMIISV
jgi:hypothetical protein